MKQLNNNSFTYNTTKNTLNIRTNVQCVQVTNVKVNYKANSVLCECACKNYNKKYSCPPVSPSFGKLSQNFQYMVISAFKIPYDTLKSEYNSIRMANVVAKSLQRKIFDAVANDLKKENIKHIVLENGSCRLCKVCSLQKSEPCKHPDKMRFSLEATGVDVNDLVIKNFGFSLQWFYKGHKDNFPEYQCVVSGILTNEPEVVNNLLLFNINKFIESLSSK